MSDLFGIGGFNWIFAAAVVATCLALILGVRLWQRRGALGREPGPVASRLAVLESTMIDAQRHLVLIACDDIEHLIMIGGPADLVIENDVSRVRSEGRGETMPALAAPGQAGAARPDSVSLVPRIEPAPILAEPRAEPRRSEPKLGEARRQVKTTESQARPAANRPALAAVPTAAPVPPAKKGAAPPPAIAAQSVAPSGAADTQARPLPSPSAPRAEEAGRTEAPPGSEASAEMKSVPPGDGYPVPPQSAPVEPQFGRRDSAAAIPPAPTAPNLSTLAGPAAAKDSATAPAEARDAAVAGGAQAKPNGSAGQTVMPTAAVPWAQADSVEREIVKALGAEPRPPAKDAGGTPPKREVPAAAKINKPATTLGDLAERLEEALAREVQSAGQKGGRFQLGDLGIGEEPRSEAVEKPAPEAPVDGDERPSADRNAKSVAAAAVQADAESRREPRAHIERQDEAPVISLNSRRREAVDPLEDEMARLLGELTGDRGRR